MCLFARVAYYGFQTTEYDQQSLNGGLFILILGHSIYCRLSLYWRYFYTYSGPQRCQPRFFNPATPTKIFPLSRNPERFHRPIPIPVTSFTVNPLKIYFISRPPKTIWGGALVETGVGGGGLIWEEDCCIHWSLNSLVTKLMTYGVFGHIHKKCLSLSSN